MQAAAEHAATIHGLVFLVGGLAFIIATRFISFHSNLLKWIAALSIVAVSATAFWLTTPATPDSSVVNGTYRSPCCEAIRLQDGVLITPRQKIPFELQLLKFGLIGELEAPLDVRNGRVVATPNAPTKVLSFREDLRAITICGPKQCGPGLRHQFVRM